MGIFPVRIKAFLIFVIQMAVTGSRWQFKPLKTHF